MEKSGFVYIWFDRKHKRYYVGSHWGTEDDGYICSSQWMKRAQSRRPEDFKRRIIKRGFSDKKSLLAEESRYLKMMKIEELRTRYYNLRNFDTNHWSALEPDYVKSISEKLSQSQKEAYRTDPGRARRNSEAIRKAYEDDPSIKDRISNSLKRAYAEDPEMARRNSEAVSRAYQEDPTYRQRLSDIHKGLMTGEDHPLFGVGHKEESKRKMSEAHRDTRWITDGSSCRMVKATEAIPEGWRYGRK